MDELDQLPTLIHSPEDNLKVTLYPNPISDQKLSIVLNGEISNQRGGIIFVQDVLGRIIDTKRFYFAVDNQIELNLPSLNQGIYILRLEVGKKYATGKVLVLD